MKVDVLLGLQWGDEGKGKVVDVLTPRYQAEYDVNFIHDLFEKFNRKKTILPSKVLIFR